jgi:Protein of unknown function (DUF3011)
MRNAMRAVVALAMLALVVPAAPPAWAARGTIRCESRNNSRNFCRVDTENNVSLRQQLSSSPCQRNRTWGFDGSGIWVDRGCRGEFDFGRSSNNSNNNNAAIAAGILGAFALGAAIAGSQDQNIQPVPTPLPGPRPPPPVRPVRPPSWAVGSFRAWDPDFRSTVILDVSPDGRVFLRDQVGRPVNQGAFRDGMVFWNNGQRSWVAREGPGIMLGDVNSGRHFNFSRS